MTKRYPRSFHCGPRTVTQIEELAALFGGNKSEVIRMSVDRMWLAEIGHERIDRSNPPRIRSAVSPAENFREDR